MSNIKETNSYYDRYKRNKNSAAFYRSTAWKKARELALKRDNYLCQSCLSKKKVQKAELVHHIKELVDHPELSTTLDNLISWCNNCHNSHHKGHSHSSHKRAEPVSKKINVYVSKNNPDIF